MTIRAIAFLPFYTAVRPECRVNPHLSRPVLPFQLVFVLQLLMLLIFALQLILQLLLRLELITIPMEILRRPNQLVTV